MSPLLFYFLTNISILVSFNFVIFKKYLCKKRGYAVRHNL